MKAFILAIMVALAFVSCNGQQNNQVETPPYVDIKCVNSVISPADSAEQEETYYYYTTKYNNKVVETNPLWWDGADFIFVFDGNDIVGIVYDDADAGYFHQPMMFGTNNCADDFVADWQYYAKYINPECDSRQEWENYFRFCDYISKKYSIWWNKDHFIIWYAGDSSFVNM